MYVAGPIVYHEVSQSLAVEEQEAYTQFDQARLDLGGAGIYLSICLFIGFIIWL